MNYVIFHDDLDGYMSAAIAKYSLPETASFYVTQYNKPFPIDLEKVSKDDELLIVDFLIQKRPLLNFKKSLEKLLQSTTMIQPLRILKELKIVI